MAVVFTMAAMFALTTLVANTYRAQRRARAEAHFAKGNVLLRESENHKAVSEFREALAYSHDSFQYRLALALALIKVGDLGEAQAHLSELQESDPTSGIVNLKLAQLAARRGDFQQAVTYYHRAIYGQWTSQPEQNRIQARFDLIAFLVGRKAKKEAIGELLQMAGEVPDDPPLKDRIGNMLLEYGAPANAADIFQDVLSEHVDAGAYFGLGQANFAQADYTAAQHAFRRALHMQPDNQEIRQRLALTDQIVALDPTVARLSSAERYDRSRQLVSKALAALERCAGAEGEVLPDTFSSLMAEARKASPRRREGETPHLISLAEQLWQARAKLCASPPQKDEPLAFVLAKIAKQTP